MRHKWSLPNDHAARVADSGTSQCLKCGIYRQYVKGKAEYWIKDSHMPQLPKCQFKMYE